MGKRSLLAAALPGSAANEILGQLAVRHTLAAINNDATDDFALAAVRLGPNPAMRRPLGSLPDIGVGAFGNEKALFAPLGWNSRS